MTHDMAEVARVFQDAQERLDVLRSALRKSESEERSLLPCLEEASINLEQARMTHEELVASTEELRVTRAALEVERRRYEDLFELAPDAYLVTDAEGLVVAANRAAVTMLGAPLHVLRSKPLASYVDEGSRTTFRVLLSQGQDAAFSGPIQLHLRQRDGPPLPVEVTAGTVQGVPGKPSGMTFLVRDLSRRLELESRLRDTEERFRELVENMREVFWAASADMKVRYVSPSYEDVWRRPVVGLYADPGSWFAFVVPEDRARVRAEARKNRGYDLRYRILRGDGKVRWIRDRAIAVRDASGTIRKLVGIAEDVTAQIRDQQAVLASETRYRSIVETLNDAHIEADAEGRIMGWNPRAEIVFGWAFPEVAGRLVADVIIPPRLREAHVRGMARFLASGEGGRSVSTRMESLALHKNGHEIPIELSLWPVTVDGELRLHALVRDISQRVEARELLRAEKERAQRLLDLPGVVVLLVGAGGRIVLANRFACDLLGLPEDELTGRTIVELWPGCAELLEAVERMSGATGGESMRVRTQLRGRGGATFALEWQCAPFTEDRATVLCSAIDVTERERAAQLLVEKSSLEKLGEMAAVVAHQVRNPLASIAACAQSLEARLPEESSALALVSLILERSSFLGATVDHILEFARQRAPVPAPFALLPLLRDTVMLVAHHPDIAGKQVVVEGEELVIRGDAPQLKQAFSNLVMNAAQASGPGQTIRVVVGRDGERAQIDVVDSGAGIPADARESIFQPFFSTKHSGAGLGLAIVQNIVRGHRGSVEVHSPEEGGTVMRVTLPVDLAAEAAD